MPLVPGRRRAGAGGEGWSLRLLRAPGSLSAASELSRGAGWFPSAARVCHQPLWFAGLFKEDNPYARFENN